MVAIEKHGKATCLWCGEHAEGVSAEFKDGLRGFFCKKHFWQALVIRQAHAQRKEVQPPRPEAAPRPQP